MPGCLNSSPASGMSKNKHLEWREELSFLVAHGFTLIWGIVAAIALETRADTSLQLFSEQDKHCLTQLPSHHIIGHP